MIRTILSIAILFGGICFISCSNGGSRHDDHQFPKYVIAYAYPGSRLIQKEEIDAARLSHIIYSFANIVDGRMVHGYATDAENLALLGRMRDSHPHLKVMVAAGGWTWSGNFSDMALTAESRAIFIESAVQYLEEHRLDGIDLDWEYPGLPGDNNVHRPEDKENFTALLRELRQAFDAKGGAERRYLLTIAAATFQAYVDNVELPEIAEVLDFINLMTYDFIGEWSNMTGHHTNLYSPAHAPGSLSVDSGVRLFLENGVTRDKLVIGAAFYGRGWGGVRAESHGLYQPGRGLTNVNLRYHSIVTRFLADTAFEQRWDEQASAPYLWNAADSIFITYDNPESLRAKAAYVKEQDLKGIMFWQLFADHDGDLLNTLHEALSGSR